MRKTDALALDYSARYLDALLASDHVAAEAVVVDALQAGVEPAVVQAEVITPAMRTIGELWECAEITVADEHLATAISHQALILMLEGLTIAKPRSAERVLLAAVEGQHHVLGLRMISDVLEGAGYDVMYLGANVPVEALKKFAVSHSPTVVGLAFGVKPHISSLVESIYALKEVAPESRIMLGGSAATPDEVLGDFPWVSSSTEVLPTIRKLIEQPPQTIPDSFSDLRQQKPLEATEQAASVPDSDVTEKLARIAEEASEISRKHVRRAEVYRDLSLRDPVTNLANRRAFDDRMYAQSQEEMRGSILMIDVDRFKEINDQFGHSAGDEMLKQVADAIIKSVRPTDFAARIGGDEFAVLLPKSTLDEAREIGERVRQTVLELANCDLTVSIGVNAVGDDARRTMLVVDQALYAAKAAGRNAVIIADS